MGKKKVVQVEGVGAATEDKAKSQASSGSSKKIENGKVFISASYNNTVITVTDSSGNVLAWSSSGTLGFSGPKKATPFAASKIVSVLSEKMKKSGPFNLDIVIKGVGSGRDSAVRTFAAQGFNILSVKDATPVPHNGPRPKKVRRV